jgi:uncharacterized membrane protein
MNTAIDEALRRWVAAGLIDGDAEARIRSFEAGETRHAGVRWQVILALAFGSILLAAGVALFVAAHWDALAPLWRFLITLAMVAVFHVVAIAVRDRFAWLATALHAVGTVAAGAAVFLTGQIFNIREDWSAGVLLCLLAAGAGWLLLRDQVQQLMTLLLLPAWVMSEWAYRTGQYDGSAQYEFRLLAIFSIVLMTAFLGSKRQLAESVLVIAGTVTLYISIPSLVASWAWDWRALPHLPLSWKLAAWLVILACAAAGVLWKRVSLVPIGATLLLVVLLPFCHRQIQHFGSTQTEPNVLAYAVVALYSVLLAWFGVRQNLGSMINVGVLYFAITVGWFYFSDVMGKLDRSLSLMLLGVLVLGGGWLLEKMRRRLIAGLGDGASATHHATGDSTEVRP